MDIRSRKQVVEAEQFGGRARMAREAFAARGAPIPSQDWIAKRASSFLGDATISQPAVGKYLEGKSVPETPVRGWALAMALDCDPGWLVFGSESTALAPPGFPDKRVQMIPASSHRVAEPTPAPLIEVPRRRSAAKKGKRA